MYFYRLEELAQTFMFTELFSILIVLELTFASLWYDYTQLHILLYKHQN